MVARGQGSIDHSLGLVLAQRKSWGRGMSLLVCPESITRYFLARGKLTSNIRGKRKCSRARQQPPHEVMQPWIWILSEVHGISRLCALSSHQTLVVTVKLVIPYSLDQHDPRLKRHSTRYSPAPRALP